MRYLNILSVEGEIIERLEMEVQVGPKAAEKLIKQINLSEEEIIEGKPVLMKLKKILAPGLKNSTSSSSSSSSSSRSSRSSSSSSSRVSGSRFSSSSTSSASSLASLFSASSSLSRSSNYLSKVNALCERMLTNLHT